MSSSIVQFVVWKYVRHGGVMNLKRENEKLVSMYNFENSLNLVTGHESGLTVSAFHSQPSRLAFEGHRCQKIACSRQRGRP